MAIDLINEHTISIKDATRYFPSTRKGKPTHVSKLLRLGLKGMECRCGTVVYLEMLKLGSSWVTSREAIQRFAEAVTAVETGRLTPPRTRKQISRSSARAVAELENAGI